MALKREVSKSVADLQHTVKRLALGEKTSRYLSLYCDVFIFFTLIFLLILYNIFSYLL
jgi:hypothetical protein